MMINLNFSQQSISTFLEHYINSLLVSVTFMVYVSFIETSNHRTSLSHTQNQTRKTFDSSYLISAFVVHYPRMLVHLLVQWEMLEQLVGRHLNLLVNLVTQKVVNQLQKMATYHLTLQTTAMLIVAKASNVPSIFSL